MKLQHVLVVENGLTAQKSDFLLATRENNEKEVLG